MPNTDNGGHDNELARIEAKLAVLRAQEAVATDQRTQLESRLQAARLQRDALVHAARTGRRHMTIASRPSSVREPRLPLGAPVAVGDEVRGEALDPKRWDPVGLLRLIIVLLPAGVRDRYLEEWRGELYDLRADGQPWWRRTAYILDIALRGAPRQAVTLRRRGRRAIE